MTIKKLTAAGILALAITGGSTALPQQFSPLSQAQALSPYWKAVTDRAAARQAPIVAEAADLAGIRYVYGGTSPQSGFDCSGYVKYVFAKDGKSLPRTAQQQADVAVRTRKDTMAPGDLIFFVSGSHVYHVGIYAGGGTIWHAPRPGSAVKREKLWTTAWFPARIP